MPSDNDLGEFLRSRRERVAPQAAHVIDTGRRRAPGLRREELALLAGVSASYYARLEQGRDRNPSQEILQALGQVLRLTETETRYLHFLAAPAPSVGPAPGEPVPPGQADVGEGVRAVLHRCEDLAAFVTSTRRDVLAATALAGALNPAWSVGANLVEFTFLDDRARALYLDWDQIAAQAVAGLRTTVAQQDAEIGPFVADMRRRSTEFRHLWDRHDVVERTAGYKRFAAPGGRELTLHYDTMSLTGRPGLTLFVYHPLPGSADATLFEQVVNTRHVPHRG